MIKPQTADDATLAPESYDEKFNRMKERNEARTALKAGDQVHIISEKHPHKGTSGTLIAYEPYGPEVFGWVGWRVRSDDMSGEFYAKPEDLRKERRRAEV